MRKSEYIVNPTHLTKLVMIRNLIDSMIADQPNEETSANLYSSRLHVVRAIKEVAA